MIGLDSLPQATDGHGIDPQGERRHMDPRAAVLVQHRRTTLGGSENGRRNVTLHTTKLGRRGEVLLTAGLMCIALGIRYIAVPVYRPPHTTLLHELIPIPWWGAAWILAGVVALANVRRREPSRDTRGFAAVMLMFSLQTASYVISWGMSILGYQGDPRGIYSALLFIGFARILAVTAKWAEPRVRTIDLRPPREHQ